MVYEALLLNQLEKYQIGGTIHLVVNNQVGYTTNPLDGRQYKYATEMAQETLDNAMQSFGAMGMTRELPFAIMSQRLRLSRIYEGPTEVHRMVIARRTLRKYE